MPAARSAMARSASSTAWLRLMIVGVCLFVVILVPVVHRRTSARSAAQQLRYNLVRWEGEAGGVGHIEEETLFDLGRSEPARDHGGHGDAGPGSRPSASTSASQASADAAGGGGKAGPRKKKRKSIWRKHEDVSKKYHVLLTAQSSTYLNWQSLLAYQHYKKQKRREDKEAASASEVTMGGFTRLVAATQKTSDEVSQYIPSVFVEEIDVEKVRTEYVAGSSVSIPTLSPSLSDFR